MDKEDEADQEIEEARADRSRQIWRKRRRKEERVHTD